jgi:hypothetical protein
MPIGTACLSEESQFDEMQVAIHAVRHLITDGVAASNGPNDAWFQAYLAVARHIPDVPA